MDTLKLSELIGKEIRDLRFHYISENEYGLQTFYSYIRLATDIIIDIPKYKDDDDYLQLTEGNLSYLRKRFETGELVNERMKTYFIGQKIVDFYFTYYNEKVDFDHCAFIKLTNGYYLSENNSGQVGLTDIDLIILNEKEFLERTNYLKEIAVDVRSFVHSFSSKLTTDNKNN